MSSLLTNQSAMVALQTLKTINMNLAKTSSEISTGKRIDTAKDNSSIWAISKVMESDVKGFKGITESLALGESTVSVARQATETITDLLTDIKSKIVAAQEENVDRTKIQSDISALVNQVESVVNAAQFNGLNLLKGTADMNILSSLDRSSNGTVTASNITVARQDMSTDAGTIGTGASLVANSVLSATSAADTGNAETLTFATDADMSDNVVSITIAGQTLSYAVGDLSGDQDAAAAQISGDINALGITGLAAGAATNVITLTSTNAFSEVTVAATGATASAATIAERAETVTFSGSANVADGDGYQLTVAGTTFTYVAGAGETFEDVAKGLKTAVDAGSVTGIATEVSQNSGGQYVFKIDNSATASVTLAVAGTAGGAASGGLFGLDAIDVTSNAGADAALGNIETLINNSIDGAANFGSSQGRIEIQSNFIGKLTDSLKAGIGTMVDADMEAASARLQALQVQQQLGIQALSIANQAPQSILSLFR